MYAAGRRPDVVPAHDRGSSGEDPAGQPSPVIPGTHVAGLVRRHHGLHPVTDAELAEQAGDVGLHGRLAEVELGGDLRVGHAATDQRQHVALALGQGVEHVGATGARGGTDANDSITRTVTPGSSSPPPEATVRTPSIRRSGGATLSRKPLTPERRAAST